MSTDEVLGADCAAAWTAVQDKVSRRLCHQAIGSLARSSTRPRLLSRWETVGGGCKIKGKEVMEGGREGSGRRGNREVSFLTHIQGGSKSSYLDVWGKIIIIIL